MATLTLEYSRELDRCDPLREFRQRFQLPDGTIYLDGNSLGALPVATLERLRHLIGVEWGQDLIRSWSIHDWLGAPGRIGDKIATLIGSGPGETVACDSTSVNLTKLVHAALAARPGRTVVLSEPGNFPSDLYVVEGALACLGGRHSLKLVDAQDLHATVDENTALLLLTHVHYKTAKKHDMKALTSAAQAKGALVLWDLSHSVGATEVDLNGVGADLAVGCGYKYLNGGPGAPAFLFVARRHHGYLRTPIYGWMGHAHAFDFVDRYEPAGGVQQFLCGSPPTLGLAALETGVDLAIEAGIPRVSEKSRTLSDFFITLVETRCAGHGLKLVTPRQSKERGSHVSFTHPSGYPIMQALIARGVIGDFRAPDVIRFGLPALYTRYEDVWHAVEALRRILESDCWRDEKYSVRGVTT